MKLLLVITFLLTTHYTLPTITHAHSAVQVIKMTPNAFEPAEVKVDEDSTIIFINQDTVGRWPASNIHPTHELYPEFDPKKNINPGESWSFKPKKPGVWKYHDHTNPHLRGTITVTKEESSPSPLTFPNVIASLKNSFSRLFTKVKSLFLPVGNQTVKAEEFKKLTSDEQFRALTTLAAAKGGEAAWKFVTATYQGEAGSSGNIHDLAHLAGKLIHKNNGVGGIAICTPVFAFGCYHGLLDAAFATSLDDLAQAEKECEKVGPVNSGPYGSCIHGIGHGVASFHKTLDLTAALTSCERLTNGRDFCYDGAFMEFARGAPPSFYPSRNPLYPCDSLEERYGPLYSLSCGRNQPTVLISRLGLTFEQAIKLCGNNRLSDKFKGSCFDALGFMLASSGDPDKIIAGCKSIANPNFSAMCFKSAAGELVFQEVPGWDKKSTKVCAGAPLKAQAFCQENLARLIREYGRKKEQSFNLLQDGENKDEYVRAQMAICYQSAGSDDCYKKAADLFSKQLGLKTTLEIFKANEQYPEIYSRCHEATHYLSRNEYEKVKSIAQVYSQCNSTCHGGCYHGTLEQYLAEKDLTYSRLKGEFPKVCGTPADFATPLVFNECMHGLGHAAMFVTDMEVRDSLTLCDTLEAGKEQERCFSGVFMENSSSSTNNDHPGRYVKRDDPLFPCNVLDEKYAKICWRYQSSHFALITNHNWSETAALCQRVPERYQDDCVRTIGTNQVGFTQDTTLMRKNCSLMPNSHFQETCLQGVISSFAYRFVGDEQRMENFCTSVKEKFQEACFKQMGISVVDWSKDATEALAWCGKIASSQFSSWCKSAVN